MKKSSGKILPYFPVNKRKLYVSVILACSMCLLGTGCQNRTQQENEEEQEVIAEVAAEPESDEDDAPTQTPEPTAEPTAEPIAEPTEEPVAEPTEEPAKETEDTPAASPSRKAAEDSAEVSAEKTDKVNITNGLNVVDTSGNKFALPNGFEWMEAETKWWRVGMEIWPTADTKQPIKGYAGNLMFSDKSGKWYCLYIYNHVEDNLVYLNNVNSQKVILAPCPSYENLDFVFPGGYDSGVYASTQCYYIVNGGVFDDLTNTSATDEAAAQKIIDEKKAQEAEIRGNVSDYPAEDPYPEEEYYEDDYYEDDYYEEDY